MRAREAKSTITPDAEFAIWLERFGRIIEQQDSKAFSEIFTADGYWRDILAFTWEHRTFAGSVQIDEAFGTLAERVGAKNLRVSAGRSAPRLVRRSGRNLIEGYFDFDTQVGAGVGFVRLLHDSEDPLNLKVWTLLTTLHAISGFEEQVDKKRPTGDEFSRIVSPENWSQIRERESSYSDREPQVVIIGAGQGGLILGARLRQMGVDTLIVEKAERVGDNWRNRYNNLTLHNEVVANHFPYMPFPETWPLWLPKDMMAGWLEAYAEFLELNVWTATEVNSADFDDTRKEWTLSLRRADGSLREMRCKHLVIATGVSGGAPKKAKISGLDDFDGVVMHSSEFRSGLDWKDKHAIVIGTGNSGHDVAQDLYISGAASVSIMQRGATCVVSLDPSARISYSIYTEGRSVEDADLMAASIPYPVLIETYKWVTKRTRKHDKELLDGLHSVGFKTHDGADDTGFQLLYLRGAGGYYINVGCSELIIEKNINLIQVSESDGFEATGLRMKDGDIIPADVVVLATGFEGIESSVSKLLGAEVAERLGPIWGFDDDYVMKNMWRRTAQDGLWLMGGAIIEARLYSRYLALEIRAALEGMLPEKSEMPLVKREVHKH